MGYEPPRNRQYLSQKEMEDLPPERLEMYLRRLNNEFFKNREVAKNPSVLDRWKDAKRIAKTILAKRKPKDE